MQQKATRPYINLHLIIQAQRYDGAVGHAQRRSIASREEQRGGMWAGAVVKITAVEKYRHVCGLEIRVLYENAASRNQRAVADKRG